MVPTATLPVAPSNFLQGGAVLTPESNQPCTCFEKDERVIVQDRLEQWESQLPGALRLSPLSGALDASFWASMLHFNSQQVYQLYHAFVSEGPNYIDLVS